MSLPYTAHIANKLGIPRVSFNGFCCFTTFCVQRIETSQILQSVNSESEYFVVPGLPHRIEITEDQLPKSIHPGFEAYAEKMKVAEAMIFNSFEELESEYIQEFKKACGSSKVWCVGPVSQCNKDDLDKFQRGNKATIDESECLKWLDLEKPESVLYVCFGSLYNLKTLQLIELGLGLEVSNRPFIWVMTTGEKSRELDEWIKRDGFEERVEGRGLIIRGWAPQLVILSHEAIGGLLTHCGWNSILEGITSGKPMVTWPLFADQFLNERFVLYVLKIGVKIGAEGTLKWAGEEKIGVSLVKKEDVKMAVNRLMGDGEESEERRKRVKELSCKGKGAMEEDGSSYLNMELLIRDITQQASVV